MRRPPGLAQNEARASTGKKSIPGNSIPDPGPAAAARNLKSFRERASLDPARGRWGCVVELARRCGVAGRAAGQGIPMKDSGYNPEITRIKSQIPARFAGQ